MHSCFSSAHCILLIGAWCDCFCLEPEAETEYEYEHEVSNEVEHEDPSYDPNDFSSGKMTEPR